MNRIILGNSIVIAFIKSQNDYMISSMYPKKPNEIYKLAESSGLKDIQGMVPTESQVAFAAYFGFLSWLIYQMVQTIRNQNSYTAKRKDSSNSTDKKFSDVGGCERAKKALGDILDFMKRPEHYKQLGITMPQGVLLYGPPGSGKTLLAKAAACEANIPVLYASGAEFVEIYVGMGAMRVRNLFK